MEIELQGTKEENGSLKSCIEQLKEVNHELIITLQQMEKSLKDMNIKNKDLLNKLEVVDREIKTLIYEKEKLQRLNENLQNTLDQNPSENNSRFHKYQENEELRKSNE